MAIPDVMKENVTDISPSHWRIQAALIKKKNSKIMIINSYFPQDSKSLTTLDHQLEELIAAINSLLMNYQFDDVIWMGDVNADFCRNTKHVWRIGAYLNDTKLVKAWDSFQIDFTHEFENDQTTFTCNIDHFFWNANLNNKVLEAGVLHLPDNLSDHSPIYCKIDYEYAEQEEKTPINSSNRALKLNWESLTQIQKDGINYNIEERMLNIQIPSCIKECRDVHCQNKEHIEAIDSHLYILLGNKNDCARNCLPPTTRDKYKRIPGWNDEVKPFREQAMFYILYGYLQAKTLKQHTA